MKETNGQIFERQKVHRDIPWTQVIVRKSGKVSWLMNLNLLCFHYRDHSTSWLLIFQGGSPELEFILWIEWCFNVSILQLVATWLMVGLPTRGLTLRRWKNTRPFGPRCEPRATWWQFLVKVVQPNGGGARLGEKYRSCWKKKRQIALDMWGAVNLFEDQFSTDRAKMVQNVRAKVPKKT